MINNHFEKKLGVGPFFQSNIFLIMILSSNLSGCGYVVSSQVYAKEKEKNQSQLEFMRRQMAAHTKILAEHGRSINEIQVQLRQNLTKARDVKRIEKGIEKSVKRAIKDSSVPRGTQLDKSPAITSKKSRSNFAPGIAVIIRSKYRGLPLNFAGGYRTPRGKRYPFKLSPGTLVEVLSGDRRGFTQIEVKTGRWKGKKMWVRTRWLVQKPNSPPPSLKNG